VVWLSSEAAAELLIDQVRDAVRKDATVVLFVWAGLSLTSPRRPRGHQWIMR
jgi:hypothetical protein